MSELQNKVSEKLAQLKGEFEKKNSKHAALLNRMAQLGKTYEETGKAIRDLNDSPEYVTAQKESGAAMVPLRDMERASKFVPLFDVLAEVHLDTVPASVISAFEKIPVIGEKITAQLGRLFPSESSDRTHGRITKKVSAQIDGAFAILRTL